MWTVSAQRQMTCSLAFLHDVCVSFLCKRHGTRVQSLTIFHSIKIKIKIQILIWKSAFAPNGNQPLPYGGNFAVFCQKSDVSYSFSEAITPTPPHPGKQQSGSLSLTWSGKSITQARVLAGVGMSVPLHTSGQVVPPDGGCAGLPVSGQAGGPS